MSRAGIIRHKTNPFIDGFTVSTKKQKLRVSNSAQINDETWINNTTGELATTQLYTYREVDETQFVKLFTQNIALTFNLTSAGLKALNVLIYAVQYRAMNKDTIIFNETTLKDFLEIEAKKGNQFHLSLATFTRGVSELIKSSILARCERPGDYFINPNFVFNGDRLLFVNAIKKKSNLPTPDTEHIEISV